MGPTDLLPGSHFVFSMHNNMGHYGGIQGSVHAVLPAGSIFLTVYNIWHRRSASTGHGVRNNLKYNYWRTVPPARDWIIEPDFDVAAADYSFGGFLSTEVSTGSSSETSSTPPRCFCGCAGSRTSSVSRAVRDGRSPPTRLAGPTAYQQAWDRSANGA
jgi:hypothetical protein